MSNKAGGTDGPSRKKEMLPVVPHDALMNTQVGGIAAEGRSLNL